MLIRNYPHCDSPKSSCPSHHADELPAAFSSVWRSRRSAQFHRFPPRLRRAQTLGHQLIYAGCGSQKRAALLKQFKGTPHIAPSPDTSYHFVAHAPDNFSERPVVIGTGPCGLFAGLLLAQMGFRPIILERGKAVRERTKDTFGLWRQSKLDPESNVQFGEGGAGLFRRQAAQPDQRPQTLWPQC
jgi:uncharacterized FAD-dependent dehydrogenase